MIVDLLKKYTGMTDAEIENHFNITETEKETVISSEWLETGTFAGMKKLITEQGGWYEVVKAKGTEHPVFHLPKPKIVTTPIREGSEGVTPESINTENNKDNGDYSLARSMKGKLGQLVPCLADASGEVFDGLHRKKINPAAWTVKLDQVKTVTDKVMARLIANNCRRKYMDTEFQSDIGFLKGAGFSAEQIHEVTGIGMTTIYKYMPQELKNKELSEAQKKGHEESATVRNQEVGFSHAETISKIPDTEASLGVATPTVGTHARINHTALTECENCHLGTEHPQPFGRFSNLCEKCFDRTCRNPAEFKRPTPEPKVQTPSKPKETADYRVAQMHPTKSKMEEKIVQKLRAKGYHVTTDVTICLTSTNPDFNVDLPNGKIVHGYVDGPVHDGKQKDADDELRGLLRKRFPESLVVSVDTKGDSEAEANEKVAEIEEEMKW